MLSPETLSFDNFQLMPLQTEFLFHVTACHGAHISLGTKSRQTQELEVVLGADSNRRAVILDKRGGSSVEVQSIQRPGLLSCDRDREFLLSWSDGVLKVREGRLHGELLLDWVIPNCEAAVYLGFSTEPGAPGHFLFDRTQGRKYFV